MLRISSSVISFELGNRSDGREANENFANLLGRQIEKSMAVAIDGEIFQDAYLAPLKPESEIYLIPKIGGG